MNLFNSASSAVGGFVNDAASQGTEAAEETFEAIVDAAEAAAPGQPSGTSVNGNALPDDTQQAIQAAAAQLIDTAASMARGAAENLGDRAAAYASPGLQGLAFGATKLEQFADPGIRGVELWAHAFDAGMTVAVAGLVGAVTLGFWGVAAPAVTTFERVGRLVSSLRSGHESQPSKADSGAGRELQADLVRLDQQIGQLLALLRSPRVAGRNVMRQDLPDTRLCNAIFRSSAALETLMRTAGSSTTPLSTAWPLPARASISSGPGLRAGNGAPAQGARNFDRLDQILRRLVDALRVAPQGPIRPASAIGSLQEARRLFSAHLQVVRQAQQPLPLPGSSTSRR